MKVTLYTVLGMLIGVGFLVWGVYACIKTGDVYLFRFAGGIVFIGMSFMTMKYDARIKQS